jgi:branched-chain amino acid aminotransferase
MVTSSTETTTALPFGSVVAGQMVVSRTAGGVFAPWTVQAVAPLDLHPAAHALHYGSSCFEGLKAYRGEDGAVRIFRPADHAERMRISAEVVCLPVPDAATVVGMIRAAVEANLAEVPAPPGALYLRPTLIGVDANIGAAASPSREALLYVIASPVGDYFDTSRALTVAVETRLPRSTPQFGRVKSGANYAMALGITTRARAAGADQVLFAPGGDVQETGASNFLLLDDDRVVTRDLDGSFLAGITRNSVLALARDLGYTVEERPVSVTELLEWAERGEAALSGTAAGLSGVGTLLHDDRRIQVGTGAVGPNTHRLRSALIAVQRGQAPDPRGWNDPVGS